MSEFDPARAELNWPALAELTAERMTELDVPGAAVGVQLGPWRRTAGFGVTNVDHPLPVDADTLFQVGSISKVYTATAALRLVEQGRLDLDRPIRHYLPALRLADADVTARLTLRHLFAHLAGWAAGIVPEGGRGDDALARAVARLAEIPQLVPLGAVWAYNNAGMCLAGRVIEVVTGLPFETAVSQLVLAPLKLRRTCYFAEDAITARVAVGHARGRAGPRGRREWAVGRAAHPAGGVATTIAELLDFASAHLPAGPTAGPRLLQPATLAAMQTPFAPMGSWADEVGIIWMLESVGGARVVKHIGMTRGQHALLLLVPERGFALGVLTNGAAGGALCDALGDAALDRCLGLRRPAPVPLSLAPAQLAAYAGRYVADAGTVVIDRLDGTALGLWLEAPAPPGQAAPPPGEPVRLIVTAPERVLAVDGFATGQRGEFLREAGGAIRWFRWAGCLARRVTGRAH